MNQEKILKRVQDIFNDIFLEPVDITLELSAQDVEEWDSYTHITLIIAIEKEFDVRFVTGEVENTQNIGDLINLIEKHLKRKK